MTTPQSEPNRATEELPIPKPSHWLPIHADSNDGFISLRTANQLTLGILFVGALAYIVRFGLRFPLWPDESFLVLNLARRDLFGILEPLEYHQVAPPLFLFTEKLILNILGMSEWSIRLFPQLCSIASLLLFRSIAGRLLKPTAYVFAFSIFAVSYWILRYSSEIKPYALDLLLSLIFIYLACQWRDAPARLHVLVSLCFLAFICFSFSYPSIFIGGGVCVFMVVSSLKRRSLKYLWHPFIVGICLSAGFAAAYFLHVTHQVDAEISWMRDYWTRAFPPIDTPLQIFPWFILKFTGEMLPYPFGGESFGSILTAILVTVGFIALIRAKRFEFLLLLITPIFIAFVAAALKRYPFGEPTRCQLYLAPIFCLFAGLGFAHLIQLISRGREHNSLNIVKYSYIVLVVIACITICRDLINQAKSPTDRYVRDFTRFFFKGGDIAGEQSFCLREDFKQSFSPVEDADSHSLLGYLCNYYIYGQSGRLPFEPDDWSDTVRIANYRTRGLINLDERDAWISEFEQTSGLTYVFSALHPIPLFVCNDYIGEKDVIEIMTFQRPLQTEEIQTEPPASDELTENISE